MIVDQRSRDRIRAALKERQFLAQVKEISKATVPDTKEVYKTISESIKTSLPGGEITESLENQNTLSAVMVQAIEDIRDSLNSLKDQIALSRQEERKEEEESTKEENGLFGAIRSAVDSVREAVLGLKIDWPKLFKVEGEVSVKNLDIPDTVKVSNLESLGPSINKVISTLESMKPLLERKVEVKVPATKMEMPNKFSIDNEVAVKDWGELLDAMEELKKGFNLLINKKDNGPTQVEITNYPPRMVPQPVTNININPLRGYLKTTVATVTTALTPLPTYGVLDNRRSIIVFNNSSTLTLYVGGSDVTSANGLPVPPLSYSPPLDAGPKMIVYGRSASGSIDTRVMEVSNDAIGG